MWVSWGEMDPCVSISKGFSASLLTRQKRRKQNDPPLSRSATAPPVTSTGQARPGGQFVVPLSPVLEKLKGSTSGRSLTGVRDDNKRGMGKQVTSLLSPSPRLVIPRSLATRDLHETQPFEWAIRARTAPGESSGLRVKRIIRLFAAVNYCSPCFSVSCVSGRRAKRVVAWVTNRRASGSNFRSSIVKASSSISITL